jgi:hypothetical protein
LLLLLPLPFLVPLLPVLLVLVVVVVGLVLTWHGCVWQERPTSRVIVTCWWWLVHQEKANSI